MSLKTTWVKTLPHLYSSQRGILFFRLEKGRDGVKKYSYHRLKSERLMGAIDEIEREKIYLKNETKNPKEKLRDLKGCVKAIKKISKAVEFFSWGGFKGLRYEYCPRIEFLLLNGKTLFYNPEKVLGSSDLDITKKLRSFVGIL
jgi:hypothetical protein